MSRIDDLIRDLCPDGVEYKPLGEIGCLLGGLTGKTKADFVDGTARYVSYKNVYSNIEVDVTADDFVKISESETQNALQIGDILFTGSSENREEAGLTSVVTSLPPEPLYLNSFCICFRPDVNFKVIPEFSKHLFRSHRLRKEIARASQGVTRFNISRRRLSSIKIPIPPLEIQREVATALDELTQQSKELGELLQKEQTLLFAQYSLHKKVAMHSLSTFPVRTINDVVIFINGKPHERLTTPSGDTALMTAKFVSRAGIADRYIHSDDAKTPALAGDVALVMSDLPGGRALARAFLVPADNKYAANQRVCLLRTINPSETDPRFLFHIVNRNQQLLNYDNGFDQTHLKRPQIEGMKIPYPPPPIQRHFAKLLDRLDTSFEELNLQLSAEIEARRRQYEYYRDRLLTFPEKK